MGYIISTDTLDFFLTEPVLQNFFAKDFENMLNLSAFNVVMDLKSAMSKTLWLCGRKHVWNEEM